jgi:hypothetical protein
MRAAALEAILRSHPYVRVERPPRLWGLAAELEAFVRCLGEMIAAALAGNGGRLADVTVNVSNVTVEPSAAGPMPAGDFVVLTIRSQGNWMPEATWHPRLEDAVPLVNPDLTAAAAKAGAAYGYTRALPNGDGSVTLFFERA